MRLPTPPLLAQAAPVPPPKEPEPNYKIPKFDIRVQDLAHPGAVVFFALIHPTEALTDAVLASYQWLYTPGTTPTNVEKITLILREMDGVAYTTGSHTEKEIHFSLDHILNSIDRAKDEINGVLVHEVVHCYQHNAKGTAPGGLIEGIAARSTPLEGPRRGQVGRGLRLDGLLPGLDRSTAWGELHQDIEWEHEGSQVGREACTGRYG